jgi:hypothetical protein
MVLSAIAFFEGYKNKNLCIKLCKSQLSYSSSSSTTLLFVGVVAEDENIAETVGVDEADVVGLLVDAFVKHLPPVGFLNWML